MGTQRRKLSDDPLVKLIRQHGYVKVQRAVNFASGWAWLEQELGRRPTMTEYVEQGAMSRTGAFREQAAFREVTGQESPEEIIAAARRAGIAFGGKNRPDPVEGLGLVPFLATS